MGQEVMFSEQLCVSCGECAAGCRQGVHQLGSVRLLDRARCMGCGICAENCPTGAVEMAAQSMSVEEVLHAAVQDAAFYGDEGGLTLSGGEPMAQPAGALALLHAAKAAGLHTAIETCGYFHKKHLPALAQAADLFLWDLKDSDPERHKRYTGVGNEAILDHLRTLDALGAAIELRCILVRGVNLNDGHLTAIAETYRGLRRCPGVTLLPYHAYGSSKARQLGRPESGHPEWIPAKAEMDHARAFLQRRGVSVLT